MNELAGVTENSLDLKILALTSNLLSSRREFEEYKTKTDNSIKELITIFKALIDEKETIRKENEEYKKNTDEKLNEIKKSIETGDLNNLKKLFSLNNDGMDGSNSTSIASKPTYNQEDLKFLNYCKGRSNGCNKGGNAIYGNNPYTDDSDCCLAALHGNIIGNEGGFFLVKNTGTRANFPSVTVNGITSQSWNQYNSITFERFNGHFTGTFNCGPVTI
jgi:hypothetical protein